MSFTERLRQVQIRQNSLLCIGLDVDMEIIPAHLQAMENPALEFNRQIVEATHDLVCAYKPNLAFYEAMGESGISTLRETLKLIPKSVLTLGDGKRGDIGNTAERYAKSLFDDFGFDAITVNPYMGFDSVEPFLKNPDKGVFILALTSNPGSKDFQRLKVGKKPLYEKVVHAAKKWNTFQNISLVVGATHPKELQRIRKIVPDMPILIPGIGKQGGDLKSAIRYGCNKHGQLAIINASRSVIYASSGKDFAEAARAEAKKMLEEMRMYIG
ncbi:MAG: orotidine-5'-phosphate decarboxylase [Bacteroidota bacterium]|jgi:orotidine-5'-phosphate decarboxylase